MIICKVYVVKFISSIFFFFFLKNNDCSQNFYTDVHLTQINLLLIHGDIDIVLLQSIL